MKFSKFAGNWHSNLQPRSCPRARRVGMILSAARSAHSMAASAKPKNAGKDKAHGVRALNALRADG